MIGPIRLGMLTPSSNTVLEPTTSAILSGLPDVSAHFSRFKVTEIAMSDRSHGQFDEAEILRAAILLADAKVDVIAWSGTSASWLGFDRDEALCAGITDATGIPSCTSALAFREIFQRTKATQIGLVTPYLSDVQSKIMTNWRHAGFPCTAERHCGLQENFSFAEVSQETIAAMIRDVALQGCDAVAVVCTNMRAAALVENLERELGLPIYDSIATTIWKSLALVGVRPDRLQGWGRLFRDLAAEANEVERRPHAGRPRVDALAQRRD